MSKRNLLLGTAAGKVGDLVFYRAGGEQRTRAKVTPNNPKTYTQQAQRSRLANVTLTYRALSALCKDTFTNRKPNQTPFNAFSADALLTAPYLHKDDAAKGQFIIAPTLVAKGSVPVPWTQVSAQNDSFKVYANLAIPTAPHTVGELAAALIGWRPCCFETGGALIIAILESPNDIGVDTHRARYIKIPIDPNSQVNLSTLGVVVNVQAGTEDNPALTIISIAVGSTNFGGAAVVEKPKTGGGYDVCDARLTLCSIAQEVYEDFCDDESKRAAAESYGGTQGACVINS